MPTYYPATAFVPQFLSDTGIPLSGGSISAFVAETSTPTPMYIDFDGTSAGAVITLNARGEPQVSGNTVIIWLDSAVEYKFQLKNASGVSIWTADDVASFPHQLVGSNGAYLIGYGGSTVGDALEDLDQIQTDVTSLLTPQAEGPEDANVDPEDDYSIFRRFQELHKFQTANIEPMTEDRLLRAGRTNRACVLKRDTNFSVPNSSVTAVEFDKVTYDGFTGFTVSSPTRITVPAAVQVVRIIANISFASNSTGIRSIELFKNGVEVPGGRVSTSAVNGLFTGLKVTSDPLLVAPGDYFEVKAFQNSGGALNADVFSTFSMEILGWNAGNYLGNRLLITQGLYQDYEGGDGSTDINLEDMAAAMAEYSVVVLSHVADYNVTGCVDAKYDYIVRLIRTIRNINPRVKIFGYIEGTASAPSGCGYAAGHTYADNGWTSPTAQAEINRILMWDELEGARPDGIFIDLVAPAYMGTAHRDNVFSACKGYGFAIMANTTVPGTLNTRFACESQYFGAGDYVCIEGFYLAAGETDISGTPVTTLTTQSMNELALWRHKKVRLAALCSEAWSSTEGQDINPASSVNTNALAVFDANYHRGDVYMYGNADLGIVSKIVQTPGI